MPLPVIYGNELRPGSKIELEAVGEYTCATGVTLSLGFIYGAVVGAAGGVILAQSSVITTGTTPTAWPWHMHYMGVVLSTGTGGAGVGQIYGSGVLDFGTSLTAWTSSPIPITAAARTMSIDTTIQKALGVGAAYGTSGAGNTITVGWFSAKIQNQGKTA